jgi:hypothetical protein
MEMGLIVVLVAVAAAASFAAVIIDRRMDVLYGPFIEGRTAEPTPEEKFFALASLLVNQLRWKTRNVMYLTSVVAG